MDQSLNIMKAVTLDALQTDSENEQLLLRLGTIVLQISQSKKLALAKIKNDFDA